MRTNLTNDSGMKFSARLKWLTYWKESTKLTEVDFRLLLNLLETGWRLFLWSVLDVFWITSPSRTPLVSVLVWISMLNIHANRGQLLTAKAFILSCESQPLNRTFKVSFEWACSQAIIKSLGIDHRDGKCSDLLLLFIQGHLHLHFCL